MQSDHNGSGSFGGFQVASLESVHHGSSPTHDSQIASAVARAVQPAVAAVVAAQIQSSLREPWFADLIRATVREFVLTTPSASGSSQSNLSQTSLSSSGDGSSHGAAVAVEANLLWDVPCPVCRKVSLNENAFVEHIKLITVNRNQGHNPKIKCVLRENNDRHVKLLKRFRGVTGNQIWSDSACDFVTALRSNCNPGHKKVYVPGGTGNNKKVRKFLLECLQDEQHSASCGHADVDVDGSAPGSPDWRQFDLPSEFNLETD
jgi:hypothetical protein